MDSIEQLKQDVDKGLILAHFQPILKIKGGFRVVGFEAFAKWQTKDGLFSPIALFGIGICRLCEECSLCHRVDLQVVRESCFLLKELLPVDDSMFVAINVTPFTVRKDPTLQQMRDVITLHGMAPHNFEIELSENQLWEDELVRQIAHWRQLGFRVSIDDYGTGSATLMRLKLPANTIKIDRAFIKDIDIVEEVVRVSQKKGFSVLAEGVEDVSDVFLIKEAGCDSIQGWVFSRLLPFDDAVSLKKILGYEVNQFFPLDELMALFDF